MRLCRVCITLIAGTGAEARRRVDITRIESSVPSTSCRLLSAIFRRRMIDCTSTALVNCDSETYVHNNDNNNNDRAATDAGTVADMTATRKTEKYSTLSSAYRFEPTAVENLGVFSSTTLNFISELGRRICVHTGDAREASYLFQRISITLQRFNFVILHDTLPVDLPDL